ncbi:BamA/TamA family outer membrane protein [Spirosoma oryzicola]|uniref:BamA/TamA family outer membrane protein n=1 Tax=Spirosoma oryzicola TaxID=2898794 RepID=UPI001E639F0C|nr:BamA/TamA family outer membrane protein [Spirosoma oryzicola]UHG90783.1 BamA/TamA family outer membrane protein [Spirosoma oryzicola]
MKFFYSLVFLSITGWLVGQTTAVRAQTAYRIFLLGDAGAPVPDGKDPVLNTLRAQLQTAGPNSSLILLGDNIYQHGLPDADHPDRADGERRMSQQLDLRTAFPGRIFAIPGNHDWDRSGREGWQRIKNQQDFVRQYTGRDDVFFPNDGCPGPVEIPLSDSLTLVLMDTQYWLHPWDKPGEGSDCGAKTLPDFLTQLDDILYRNRHRRVVVAGHHPMYSHGQHGGYYTFKDHLFPLTSLRKWLYIPLPVIGSIYPVYRSVFGSLQDLPNPVYRELRNGMVAVFNKYRNLIYTNGHDHNLQLIQRDSLYYLTSGSGSKEEAVKKARESLFAREQKGFARLDFGPGDQMTISFFAPSAESPTGELLYQKVIQLRPNVRSNSTGSVQKEPDSARVVPGARYAAGSVKRFWFGDNYRDVWTSPLTVPVLDLKKEQLVPTERGGGMQTLSLRLVDPKKREYAIRSIEKYPEKAIPTELRSGLANDIVQDQISASHPFGALAVAPLAEAAGVYHTNPRVVVTPDDTSMRDYQQVFANTLMLLEERADGNYKGTGLFGNTTKLYSTPKLLEKLQDDNDNRVDQRAVLRARLFDMWVGDWDRHDDQWRWASFKSGKGMRFEPVPRDRDQAFFVNEGILPKIASRRWLMPKIQGFDYKLRYAPGFNTNARFFDRSFLTEPGRADWLAMADSLRESLTDEKINSALRQLPEPSRGLTAETIAAKLRQRRADLAHYADEQYRFLAKAVDVVGSDKDELFDVTRRPDGQTDVVVYKLNKAEKATQVLYKRRFDAKETEEVRLYGLGGDDRFTLRGAAPEGSLVRIIGGKGDDVIIDSSSVRGLSRKTWVYDFRKNTTITGGSETRSRLSDNKAVNRYDRMAFRYDLTMPLASVQLNPDDGLFLGAGVLHRTQGFRKEPFSQQHRLLASHAFATDAFSFHYDGTFTDLLGKTDLVVNADIKAPNFVQNFFGIGNETVFNKERGVNYYRVRFDNWSLNALLQNRVGRATFFYGPAVERVEVDDEQRKFIQEYAQSIPNGERLFESFWYGGLKAGFTVDTRNNALLTTRGVLWRTALTAYKGLNSQTRPFTQLQSDLSFYASIRLPALLTIATRVGTSLNLSDNFEFFQASTLGGLTNLRGFRRTRFAGESAFFHNLDLRLRLLTIRTYLFPAYAGIVGFNDVGRVWVDGEKSSVWHHGYGGGIWLSPYNTAVISVLYALSREDRIPMLRVGFFF